jgi:hypothetical protein
LKIVQGLAGTDDAQKRRAARLVAYPQLAGEIAQKAGLIPNDFDVEAFARALWGSFLESDLAPVAPAKKGVETLLNWLVGSRGGEVRQIDDDENGREAIAYYGANATILGADGKSETNVPVYVIRADKIAEKAGGAMTKRELLPELETEGFLARNPATKAKRTWNGFAGLGKAVQYVVLRRDMIDEPGAMEDFVKGLGEKKDA